MEKLDPIVPWEPLITRSIIHLIEEVCVDNTKAERLLGYRPVHGWREAAVSYTHLRAHETVLDLVCRLLLEKKQKHKKKTNKNR